VASPFFVGFYLSSDNVITTADKYLGAVYLSAGLAAGASSTATVSITVPTSVLAGTYYVGAYADYSGGVTESNETNNGLATTGTVIVPPSDLIMTAVSTTATTVTRPNNITISYTVKNQGGGGAAGPFYVGLYLSTDSVITTADKYLGSAYLSAGLAAGASSSGNISVSVPTSIPAGTYYVGAYADYSGVVAETSETNNGLAKTSATLLVK
jgi:subtilase family serine protease